MAPHQGAVPPAQVACGILTVSDTRRPGDDGSGRAIREILETAGHPIVSYAVVPDEPMTIRSAVTEAVETAALRALIVTGGTGVTARDVTVESVADLWSHELPGFGETFRSLSYAEIGPTALLSRATAGLIAGKFVALLPGSPSGCRLAMERLIVPVLGHVAALLERQR